jgi:hypothetical protein
MTFISAAHLFDDGGTDSVYAAPDHYVRAFDDLVVYERDGQQRARRPHEGEEPTGYAAHDSIAGGILAVITDLRKTD